MNKHKLLRLSASLKNRPHLISKEGFQVIDTFLNNRNIGLMTFPDDDSNETTPGFDGDDDEDDMGVGVITIRGPLTYRTTGWEAFCGGYSYEMLQEAVEEELEEGNKIIVLDIDSGGGEAYGCFETAEQIRTMCDDAGAEIYAYIDGCACSAAYAIACVADSVTINPYGEAGSIGVLICLYNDSENLKMNGIERTFVTDGTEKIPYADDGSWRDGFIEELQQRVAELGDDFRAHVSKYTGLSAQTLKDTNAKVYSAQDSLSLGLVNQIMTRSDFIDYIAGKQKEEMQ